MILQAFKRPTACVTRAGADGDTPSERKKAEAWKLPKNAQTPQRRVHAVLGGFTEVMTLNLFQPANRSGIACNFRNTMVLQVE